MLIIKYSTLLTLLFIKIGLILLYLKPINFSQNYRSVILLFTFIAFTFTLIGVSVIKLTHYKAFPPKVTPYLYQIIGENVLFIFFRQVLVKHYDSQTSLYVLCGAILTTLWIFFFHKALKYWPNK